MKNLYRIMFVITFGLMLIPATATSPDFSRDVLQWRASLTTNANRLHKDVFPGIDLFYTGDTKTISSVFIVRPEGDPSSIRLEFLTATKLEIDQSGAALVQTDKEGFIRILHPNLHQNLNNQNQSVAGKFVRLDDKQLGVQIESYNRSLPLVIQFTSVFSPSVSPSIENPNSPFAVTITATLKDSLVGDAGQIGTVNPGDTLRYIVSITNSGTTDATGMNFSDVLDTSTISIAGSLKATPVAVNDAYVGTYNATLNVPSSGVLTNDYGVPAPTATPIAAGVTPHGTVTLNANGSFAYTPTGGYFGPDTFSYTATNSVGSNAAIAALTIPPPAPVANNDAGTASGNIQISVAAPGVLGNDQLYGATITASSTTSTQGGNVVVSADGSYTYNPPAGYEGSDTFTYTVTNSTNSSVGTVTITVSGMIWFINNNVGVGNGRLTSPFNTIEAFRLVNNGTGNNPAANDNIFVYESATPYIPTATLTLLAGQKLIGQDASATLSSISGVTPPTGSVALPAMNSGNGTFTIISTTAAATNGITLGSGNTIRGLTAGPTTGAKIFGSAFGTLTLGNSTTPDVILAGNGGALNLTNGTFAATSALTSVTSTSSTGAGVSLTTVGGTVAFGSTTLSGIATQGIFVSGSTVTVDFGNTSVTGGTDAISLQNNSSGVRTFGTIATSSNSAIGFSHSAAGGSTALNGTVTITNPGGTGIDVNASTTALAFPATTVNKSSTAGTCVNLTSNGVTMNFTSLALTASNGSGLVGTNNTATITVSAGTNTATGGPAINITAATTTPLSLTFSSVTSTNSTTTGVNLSNTTGTLTGSAGNISGAAGTAFNISGGTIGVTYSGGITQPNNAATVMVSGGHTTGTVTFQTGTLSATNGTGLQFDNADGTYNFNGTNTMNGGASSVAIFNGSAGTFSFSSNTSITNPNGGPAVNIIGGTAAVTYSGSITMSSQVQPLVSVSGGHATGTVTFNTGTLNATIGTGLQFDNADAAYNFNGTTTLNGGDAGIDILNGSGGTFNFAVASGSIAITNPTGTAFNIGGTANTAAVTYTGGITKNNAGSMVSIVNHATGTVTFQTGTLSATTASTGNGLYFDNADGTYNFNGTTTLNGGSAAVNIVNGSGGGVNFGVNASITSPADTAFAIIGGTATVAYSGNITQANNFPMVSVSGGHATGTVIFGTGTLNATNGSGLQFDNADAPAAVTGPRSFGGYNFTGTTTLNGGDAGIDIVNGSSGTFSFTSGTSITSPSGTGFNVTAGSPSVTYAGTVSQNTASQYAVSIDGTTANTINFSGTITAASTTASSRGININNANGGSVSFATLNLGLSGIRMNSATAVSILRGTGNGNGTFSLGTVNIFTNGQSGLVATDIDGTINTTNGTIDATSATAVNINGPVGLTTLSIPLIKVESAGGTANGISLQDANGSFTVNGDGTNTTLGGNASGGTISNKSGADNNSAQGIGVYLNNVTNITLKRMTINGTNQNHGIRGTSVNGFTLEYSNVSGINGTSITADDDGVGTSGEGTVRFTNLTGSASINSCLIGGAHEFICRVNNNTGTLNRLTISNSTIGDIDGAGPGYGNTAASGDDGLQIEAKASAVVNVTLQNSILNQAKGDVFQLAAQQTSTMDLVMRGNTISNSHPSIVSGVGGVTIGATTQNLGTVNLTYDISCNKFQGAVGNALTLFKGVGGTGNGFMTGTVFNNKFGVSGVVNSASSTAAGIQVDAQGHGVHTVLIKNNTIYRHNFAGISMQSGDGNATLNATVVGNLVAQPGVFGFAGFYAESGALPATDAITLNLKLGGAGAEQNNFVDGDPGNFSDVLYSRIGSSVFSLSRVVSGSNDPVVITQANNTAPITVSSVAGMTPVNTVPTTPAPVDQTCSPP